PRPPRPRLSRCTDVNVFATRWRRRATIAMRLRPPPNPLLGLPRARRRAIARAVALGVRAPRIRGASDRLRVHRLGGAGRLRLRDPLRPPGLPPCVRAPRG